jgi:hypothetical protein
MPNFSNIATRAQRLSASKINSDFTSDHTLPGPDVLNAFRHQRSIQTKAARKSWTVRCAQRLSASKINSVTITKLLIIKESSAQRLSASKINSEKVPQAWRPSFMCSTPFGIKDQFSLSISKFGGAAWCAQRLSASKINSVQRSLHLPAVHLVLNAFRHQRSIQTALFWHHWQSISFCIFMYLLT